jgi:hypothetical protein
MSRWSYKVVEIKPGFRRRVDAATIQAELDKYAAAGWELVQVLHSGHGLHPANLVFKKQA